MSADRHIYFRRPGNRALLFLLTLLTLLLWAAASVPASAREPAGPPFSAPFSYYADKQELTSVLINFARTQGMGSAISPGVQGQMSGRFDNIPPAKFLEGMHSAFGVSWYILGNTIHFYGEKETARAFITPRVLAAPRLKEFLKQADAYSPQLPPTVGADGKVLTISGPPLYLEQVTRAAEAIEQAQAGQIVMQVFPLKYAWAEDITVDSMDKTITVPGVASILRAMVSGAPASSSQIVQQPATVQKLSGTGLIAQGRQEKDRQEPGTRQEAAPANIMADPRVNAVLVNDSAYRMPYYQKVISDLDKPVELVEIHAAIVDIDADFKRELGVTYQAASKGPGKWSVGGELAGNAGSFPPLPAMGTTSSAGMSLSTIYTFGADYFLARVHALEDSGEARMLGRPSVLTVDNVQATLENTSTYYIQVQGYQTVDLFKVEAGTILRVTPHIIRNEDGKTSIKLVVAVQDDQNQDTPQANVTANSVPPIKQTKINTQAIVGEGQSLLIGGYYYEKQSKDDSGIPGLMHLPLIGNLFKTTSKQTSRMERLILITPRVIRLDEYTPVPAQADDPDFHRSPTQASYENRVPAAPPVRSGGCSRRPRGMRPVEAPPAGQTDLRQNAALPVQRQDSRPVMPSPAPDSAPVAAGSGGAVPAQTPPVPELAVKSPVMQPWVFPKPGAPQKTAGQPWFRPARDAAQSSAPQVPPEMLPWIAPAQNASRRTPPGTQPWIVIPARDDAQETAPGTGISSNTPAVHGNS